MPMLIFVLLLGLFTGCAQPQFVQGYQLPIRVVDHRPKNKHEIPLEVIKQWVIEGKLAGYSFTHQGPSAYYFKNGITLEYFCISKKEIEIAIKLGEIMKLNPKSNPVAGTIE